MATRYNANISIESVGGAPNVLSTTNQPSLSRVLSNSSRNYATTASSKGVIDAYAADAIIANGAASACCPCNQSTHAEAHQCAAAIAAASAAASAASRHITFVHNSNNNINANDTEHVNTIHATRSHSDSYDIITSSNPPANNNSHHGYTPAGMNVTAMGSSSYQATPLPSSPSVGHHTTTATSALNVSSPIAVGSSPSSSSSLEARVEDLEDKLSAVLQQNAQLTQIILKMEEKQHIAEEANNELYRRLGVLITTTGTLTERIKSLETTTFATLKAELDEQRHDNEEREKDIVSLLANFKQEIKRVADDTNASVLESTRQYHEQANQRSAFRSPEEQTDFINDVVQRSVNDTLDDFQRAQSAALQDVAKKLDQELEKRHKRLVDSTQSAITEAAKGYETAAPQIRTLQNDMLQLREQLRVQSVQIDAQRNDTSFEAAINEMKDWVQDIERKLITRTEVEECVMQLSSQLSSVKHSAQNTEALLNQKLEVEKSARESAVTQLASQLLMSGRKR